MVPPQLDTDEHDLFTHTVKLKPFQRAFSELQPDLWISSLRRYQSTHRAAIDSHEVLDGGLNKVLPMLDWSEHTVDWYREEHRLPLGPDAFDPTKGEPLRECGLHTTPWQVTA